MSKGGKKMKQTMTLREHHALFGSQMRAAEDIGVSANTYGLWICGRLKPSWKTIKVLSSKNIIFQNFPD